LTFVLNAKEAVPFDTASSFFSMDINKHLALCNRRLSDIWKLVQDLQSDGLPLDSPAFSILEEKAEYWIARLEAIGQVDLGNQLSPETGDINWN